MLVGATHTAVIWPSDDTTARGFLDPVPAVDQAIIRSRFERLVRCFLDGHVRGAAVSVAELRGLLADPDAYVWVRMK